MAAAPRIARHRLGATHGEREPCPPADGRSGGHWALPSVREHGGCSDSSRAVHHASLPEPLEWWLHDDLNPVGNAEELYPSFEAAFVICAKLGVPTL